MWCFTERMPPESRDYYAAIVENHYVGNRRNMNFEEEAALLAPFEEQVQKGQLIEVSAIAADYIEKVGHTIGGSQIYYVLKLILSYSFAIKPLGIAQNP